MKMVHHCRVEMVAGIQWRGVVELVSDAGWTGKVIAVLYIGPLKWTQAEAGRDAQDWCQLNGVKYYWGPIMSGHIGCGRISERIGA